MNIVAFETSSETISVAIARDGEVVARAIADAGQRSGELALPTMHDLLAQLGLDVKALDLVVFGQGPGSFTGVRVACGLAQGLAFGLGKRVIGLPSTLALAEAVGVDATLPILTAIDARMGEVYLAAYRADAAQPSGFAELIAPCLAKPDALAGLLDGDCDWQGVGSAFRVPALADALMLGGQICPPDDNAPAFPHATHLLGLAMRMIARAGLSVTIAPHEAAPLYVRNNVALTIAERRAAQAAKLANAAPSKAPA